MITLIFSIQGFNLRNKFIVREISWVHLNQPFGETIQVFEPKYILNKRDWKIVKKTTRDVHGLRFKGSPDSFGMWINNEDVVKYIKDLHTIYGGEFALKYDVRIKELFDDVPLFFIQAPKCVRMLNCPMYKCQFYKNFLLKNYYEINGGL